MNATLDKLKKASVGLLFMSESDYPFETVAFSPENLPVLSESKLLDALNLTAGTKVEKQELTYFFRNMTRDLPEYTAEEKARVIKFQELLNLLQQELKEAAVYRLGERQIDAYILGKLPDGSIGGLKTRQIET